MKKIVVLIAVLYASEIYALPLNTEQECINHVKNDTLTIAEHITKITAAIIDGECRAGLGVNAKEKIPLIINLRKKEGKTPNAVQVNGFIPINLKIFIDHGAKNT